MVDTRFFRRVDFVLLGAMVALIAIGCLMVYSCSRQALSLQDFSTSLLLRKQLVWIFVGLFAMLAMMAIDYNRLASLNLPIYGFALVLLFAVLLFPEVNGAHRWIIVGPVRIQPAEFAQLAVIIMIAASVASTVPRDFLSISITFLKIVPALLLILKEPDLGTPVVLCVVWATMMFISGARIQHIAGYGVAGVLLFMAAWFSGVVHQYQKDRLTIFMHLDADPLGDGYHQLRSLGAVHGAGLFGDGIFRGELTQNLGVPDEHTDFIFAGIGEEMGFLGAVIVLGIFGLLLWRCTVVALESKDQFGRVLAGGVTAMIGLHVFVNIAMALALGPVKGIPLPLVSYGGSSMLTTLIGLGIVQSIHMRRHKIAF